MILSFKKQFKPKILSGEKIHTIREDKHDRWKAGRVMQQATGARTKKYKCFNETFCTGTQIIEITWVKHGVGRAMIVKIDGRQLSVKELHELSVNDGFDLFHYFVEWFHQDFIGKIIHWTDKRY